jgi:hypothetical protein
MEECSICCEENVHVIHCLVCLEKACLNCYKIYFLSQTTALCMWCKNSFDLDTLRGKYSIKTIKEFLNHFDTFVFDKELSQAKDIDESIIYNIKNQIEINALKKQFKQLLELNNSFDKKEYEFFTLQIELQIKDPNYIINTSIKEPKYTFYKKLFEIEYKRNELKRKRTPTEHTKSNKIRRPCPKLECQGIIVSNKCIACCVVLCNDCFEIKLEKHECKKENLESVKMLKNDTKPCPGCFIAIIKTRGCDHMFCTSCHTFFAWKSLRIYDKPVGNPEYYRFLETQNKKQVDTPRLTCNTNPQEFYNSRQTYRKVMNKKETHHMVSKTFTFCNHLQSIIERINKYLNESDNRKNIIRVGYISNTIVKEKYRKRFFIIHRHQIPVVQFLQACETMRNTFPDLFYQILDIKKDDDMIKKMMENFTFYFIEQLYTLCGKCNSIHNFTQHLQLENFKKQFIDESVTYFQSKKK